LIDSFAISLLGLEPQCYQQASATEKGSIKLVLYAFVGICILSLTSTFLIGLFVSGRYYYALPISLLGTYILISIFRFSLILIKPEIKFISRLNEVVLKTTWKEKWAKFKASISGIRTRLKNIRWNTNVAIPGFTIFFRLLYLGLLAFVIIFPMTVLSNWSDATSYNEQLREKALSAYENAELSFQKQTQQFYSSSDLTERMTWYEEKVSHEYFTMKLFIRAMSYSSFGLISLVVFGLFLIPHFLLFRLMRKSDYQYVPSVNAYFESIITSDFNSLQQEAKHILQSKGFHVDALNLNFLTKNHPYLIHEQEVKPLENVTWKSWQEKITVPNEPKIEATP
jgi:uncharacterized damage-inducible protein DinB